MLRARASCVAGCVALCAVLVGCGAGRDRAPVAAGAGVFYVAGHAYGAHDGANVALHAPLLSTLERIGAPAGTAIFFAGDFLRDCDEKSWGVLEAQLAETGLQTFLVRGSHERRAFCTERIAARQGGLSYAVRIGDALVIAVDSENPARTISAEQLAFVASALDREPGVDTVFLVTHYLVWLSDGARYPNVKANQGSRLDRIVGSNYWSDVHPLLTRRPDVRFYWVAGDVAGRPDAIPAFYDRADNVTFIATGMGEVPEENLLRVTLRGDAPAFDLVPLREGVTLPPLESFSPSR